MVDIRQALQDHLHGRPAPVLFVGSGMSLRYAGAENWEGLLRRFAAKTPRPYEYYRSSADGKLPEVATGIARAFAEVWWDSNEYATSREHMGELGGPESALKFEVSKYLSGAGVALPKRGSLAAELALLRLAVVDAIITTNYDDVLPTLFPDFTPFVRTGWAAVLEPTGDRRDLPDPRLGAGSRQHRVDRG